MRVESSARYESVGILAIAAVAMLGSIAALRHKGSAPNRMVDVRRVFARLMRVIVRLGPSGMWGN